LVTYNPPRAGLAEKEVRRCIEGVGEAVEELESSCVNGVFCIQVSGDAKQVVADIRDEFLEEPGTLNHTYHWVPVEKWVQANVEDMTSLAKELSNGIAEDERWMMHMHKRRHDMSSEDLVLALTDPIERGNVDLTNPQKIIVVEILGAMAAMALLTPDQIIDANRIRQRIGLQQMY